MGTIVMVQLHAPNSPFLCQSRLVPVDHDGTPIVFSGLESFDWIRKNPHLFDLTESVMLRIRMKRGCRMNAYSPARSREDVLAYFKDIDVSWAPMRLKPDAIIPEEQTCIGPYDGMSIGEMLETEGGRQELYNAGKTILADEEGRKRVAELGGLLLNFLLNGNDVETGDRD